MRGSYVVSATNISSYSILMFVVSWCFFSFSCCSSDILFISLIYRNFPFFPLLLPFLFYSGDVHHEHDCVCTMFARLAWSQSWQCYLSSDFSHYCDVCHGHCHDSHCLPALAQSKHGRILFRGVKIFHPQSTGQRVEGAVLQCFCYNVVSQLSYILSFILKLI